MIMEAFHVTTSDTDLLAAPSRLAAVPYAGQMILEFQASDNSATDFFKVTIQLPDGSTPIDSQRIPDGATAGGINSEDKYAVAFPVTKGGHVLVALDETGTCTCNVRATLSP